MEHERGHIEYVVPRTDGDPLAEFADESAELAAEPSVRPQASSLPLHPVNSASRRSPRAKWIAAGLISGGLAAFGAGAFVFVEYPKWSSAATETAVKNGDGSDELAAALPAEEQNPSRVEPDKTPSINQQTAERPIATNGRPTPSATAGNAPGPAEAARNSSAPVARPRHTPTAEATDSALPSLTGQWSMNTRVESSALDRYEGLRLEYQVRLQQVGNRVTGDGYKSRENDRLVGTKTPITLSGNVIGDRVVLNFQERGTRRMSGGRLVLDRESEDVLRGRFSSDAAKSTGVADARR